MAAIKTTSPAAADANIEVVVCIGSAATFCAIGDSINSASDKLKDVGNALWGNSLGCIFGG